MESSPEMEAVNGSTAGPEPRGTEVEQQQPPAAAEAEEKGEERPMEMRKRIESWLNQPMRIRMTDGRTLVGTFICTDKDRNVILGSCEEYVNPPDSSEKEEPRILGLAMVPGQHIVSIEIDDTSHSPL